ncbi:MAG TPA: polysaccharide biosynthesis tyrosine autokinase [Flavisolibacter sp.]|nr:polysaccharide biosynthesis tyrosine autokinase [Flavisolibacter sp.]
MEPDYKDLMKAKDTGGGKTPRDVVRHYLAHLPLFILCLFISIGIGMLYIRYKVPKYYSSTLIEVRDKNVVLQNAGQQGSNDLLDNAMNGQGLVNLDNELQRLRSTGLMERVVNKNGFNISYFIVGNMRTSEIYRNLPFNIILLKANDSNVVTLTFSKLTQWGATWHAGSDKDAKESAVPWNSVITAEGKQFLLKPLTTGFIRNAVYQATWKPAKVAARDILSDFTVSTSGTRTTIIELSLLSQNLRKGEDILNAVAKEFKQTNIEELNKMAQNTIQFIDDRLAMVSQELKGVEGNLENFQGSNQAFDLTQQSSKSFTNSDETSKALGDISVQQRVVDMVQQSLASQGAETRLIPSTLGIQDQTLNDLVSKYNELELKKEREAPGLGEKSILLRDLNSQLSDLRVSILANLQTISRNLQLQKGHVQQQSSEYNSMISSLPRKERVLQEIKRQQSIKEGLFLYLLQKREEAAISRTSKPSSYEQIDPASGYGPVEPDRGTVYKFAIILGLLVPLTIIYLRDLLNDKIRSREDITKRTIVPILGEVGHIRKIKNKPIPALGQDMTGEQFRLIRSNLAFLRKQKDKQVILITSTGSGEGKSFISLNMAAVLAKSGKKVALVEFDLRKPPEENLNINQNKGITDYLNGQMSLQEIGSPLDVLPNLTVFPSGPFIPDPADLLLDEKVPRLFDQLKQQFDAIVVNSAPIGLVSDAQVLGTFSDVVLYIVRQNFTNKKQIGFLNDIARTGKLKNMCIVFNDVRTGVKYGYDGYGYTKGNAYYRSLQNGRRSVWTKMKNTVGIN